jgi:Family of unknown function (DUF6152)
MRTALLVLALMLLGSAPTWAHHAFQAEFDSTKKIKLQGKVIKMEWINPHTWIHIEVINAEGKPEEWMVEGGTPNVLLRRGFTKNSLEVGTEVIVDGNLAKNGNRKRASGLSITFKDGKRLFLGGSNPNDPANRIE